MLGNPVNTATAKRAKSSYRKSELLAVSRPVCGQNTAEVFSDGDESLSSNGVRTHELPLSWIESFRRFRRYSAKDVAHGSVGRNISYEVKK